MQGKGQKKFMVVRNVSNEQNCCDKLVRDEVTVLNRKDSKLPAYAFTKEQAEEIVKRCKFKVKIETDGEVYVITKIGGLKKNG